MIYNQINTRTANERFYKNGSVCPQTVLCEFANISPALSFVKLHLHKAALRYIKKNIIVASLLIGNINLLPAQDIVNIWEQSQQLYQKGKYTESVILLESIKPKYEKNTENYAYLLNLLGMNYFNMGNYTEAEKYYLETKIILEKVLGKNHSDYAISLNNLGLLYSNMGNYAEAEKYFLETKIILEKVLGEEHPNYAIFLNNLGLLYSNIGNYPKAEKYFLEVIAIQAKVLGKEHPDYANSLNNLGGLYSKMGNKTEAEKYFLEAKTNQEKVLGKEHPFYITTLNNLGGLYNTMGNYTEAEKHLVEAKKIREKVLGKEHPGYAISLNNLGLLYFNMGNNTEAEKYYLEAKTILEKILGKEHPDYVISINNLGLLYSNMGNYAEAEKYYLGAIAIRENVLGKEHPDYAISLNNLGGLYSKMGNYVKAEKYYLETKIILEKVLGEEHPNYANPINNLGVFYDIMGNYVEAEKYYLEAIAIRINVLGKEHPDYAVSLSNLGSLYITMGNYIEAEKYLLEAKTIYENVLGKENSSYAYSINYLGSLYRNMGNYVEAEKYYLEAISIRAKVLGKEHPDYAESLNNLGTFYFNLGDYEKAEKYFLDAKIIWEKVLGKEHPNYALSINNLGLSYFYMKNYSQAVDKKTEADKLLTEQVEKTFSFLSEGQRTLFWDKNRNSFEGSYSFANTYPVNSMIAHIYDNTLFTKGLLLRTANGVRDAIYSSGNEDLIGKYEQLGTIRQTITALQTKEMPDQRMIGILESRADSLDKVLTVSSGAYKDFKEDIAIKWHNVRDVLQISEAAIEFVHFRLHDGIGFIDTVFYCAMILKKDSESPIWVPLFEQSQLDLLLKDDTRLENKIQRLYSGGNPRFFNGQKLYQLVWQPLEEHLHGIETVYYSPSGVLNQIAFGAIPTDSVCLMDKYNLHLVSSTREIVSMKNNQKAFLPVLNTIMYGGIIYDIEDSEKLIAAAARSKNSNRVIFASRSISADDTRSTWGYLEGSKIEVAEIENILKQSSVAHSTYMGIEANEESFKNLSGSSPEILHIATHGFFLQDEKEISRNAFMLSMNRNNQVVRNPLLRSGLLFAGANRAWINDGIIPEIEDGILTAEEISHLNLSKTKLVVLSACETGLGEVKNSEGVFGLQRAFKLSGVETLIMSLWKVDDAATKDFMISFYQNLMSGKTKQESFKTAQLTIRKKYSNPYYWASFVMLD